MKSVFAGFMAGLALLFVFHQQANAFDCGGYAGHKHPNGGGFVAETAHADDSVYLAEGVRVCGRAKIYGEVYISGFSEIYGHAIVLHGFSEALKSKGSQEYLVGRRFVTQS
ncbi:MAG: hypothetical protein HYW49_05255 [Deltaproteobacteria bacterium]|nr:hypothetical protein [Deltaproteobacteria bacterium]